MIFAIFVSFLLTHAASVLTECNQKITNENELRGFTEWYDQEIRKILYLQALSEWNFKTNLTAHNEELMIEGEMRVNEFKKLAYKNASKYDWQNVQDENLKRQMKEISNAGMIVLPESKIKQLLSTEANMMEIYSSAKICQYISEEETQECLDEQDVIDIFATTTDANVLRAIWKKWHETLGRQIKNEFKTYVNLSNELAIGNNYSDLGAYWRRQYESPTFEADVETLWEQVKPLYVQLHAYVRKKLNEIYGPNIVPRKGLIPAHLLGDIVAYDWGGIDLDLPFQGIPVPNITGEMEKQNYTVKKILEVAEDFFQSLGLPKMPETFWKNSLFEKPEDGRAVMCHGTAWNFYNKKDFRMLICAKVGAEELYSMHHEMGHLHYFMQYKDQPFPFQNGANPAFHEAIGDVVSLSVMTPKHLQSIGLLEDLKESYESDINYLFSEALSSVSTLPISYFIDRWRWDIFKGKFNDSQINEEWWRLRKEIQGMAPPTWRDERDFDAGTIFHVATFAPFMRYFLSNIIKYQFHRALCKASGQYDPNDPKKPLFKCDIYNSKEAGRLLSKMLKLGSSQHWTYAMKVITQGEDNKMDASAILEYFQPLLQFLREDNERTNEILGWEEAFIKEKRNQNNAGAPQHSTNFLHFIINLFTLIVHLACIY